MKLGNNPGELYIKQGGWEKSDFHQGGRHSSFLWRHGDQVRIVGLVLQVLRRTSQRLPASHGAASLSLQTYATDTFPTPSGSSKQPGRELGMTPCFYIVKEEIGSEKGPAQGHLALQVDSGRELRL